MGSAWASCLDIGKRYSGIVAGCMNTIGNLGGAAAGYLTGWILDANTAEANRQLTALTAAGVDVDKLNMARAALVQATNRGWEMNFFIFSLVYVLATLLWLRFDSTKPVVPEETEKSA
jgi:Na+/melibiose symporter-like transporter